MKSLSLLSILGCAGTEAFNARRQRRAGAPPRPTLERLDYAAELVNLFLECPPARMAAGDVPPYDDTETRAGRVLFFNKQKGFGFIVPDGSSGDREENYFAHQSNVRMEGFRFLNAGQRVQYRPAVRWDGKLFAADIYPSRTEAKVEGGGLDSEDGTMAPTVEELSKEIAGLAVREEIGNLKDDTEGTVGVMRGESTEEIVEAIAQTIQEEKARGDECMEAAVGAPEAQKAVAAAADPFAAFKNMYNL